ncbi:MAG: type II toxin-antitoxin system VapC family toxin [Candidatus Gracilibacteria bacterium]
MKNFTKKYVREDFKKIYITDSSVAIKWLTKEEPFATEALKILNDYATEKIKLIVPDIFWWELGNYFGRETDSKTAYAILMSLKKYRFATYMLDNEHTLTALRIMEDYSGVSFYDASYHALAIQNKATFITCDEKYYQKARKLGCIKLLKDY